MCKASSTIKSTLGNKGLDDLDSILSAMKETQRELDKKQREYNFLDREWNRLFKESMSLL
jgi:hypothetical protein